jgi:hypothetical protein
MAGSGGADSRRICSTGQRGIVAFPVSKEGHGGSRQGGTLSKSPVGIMQRGAVHLGTLYSALMKYALVALIVLVTGCGGSPSAPTPTIPTITGQWSGSYRTTSCNEVGAAIGSGFCAAIANGGGMVFTPQQSAGSVTGTVSVGGFQVPISGTVDTAGVVVLAGSTPPR